MPDAKLARPRQVTLIGGTIIVGSVLVVLFSFQHMASLGTIEAQEAADDLVTDPLGSGLGLTGDGVQSLMRVLSVVAGGAAAAMAILGWQVLQRSRSARIALSVLAPVLLVAGLAPASFLSMLVVGATVLLWTQPARDWFAGREPAPHPAMAQRAPVAPAGPPTSGGNRLPGYAPPPGAPSGAPVVAWPAAEPVADAGRRPQALVTACIVTIVTSVITAVAMAIALAVVLADRSTFEADVAEEMAKNRAYADLDVDLVLGLLIGLLAVFVVWALVAVLLAALALRGSNGARIALIVSAFAAAAASILGILVVVPLFVGATAVGVAVLLLRGEVGAWYAARRPHS